MFDCGGGWFVNCFWGFADTLGFGVLCWFVVGWIASDARFLG